MSWLLRAAWGCLFTALSLSKGGEIFWSALGDSLAWKIGVIAVAGFGPAFFPVGGGKVLGFAWAVIGSVLLLGRPGVSASIYLAVAWGPLIFFTSVSELRRGWRSGSFGKSESILRDKNGRMADWTFKADGLEIAVDLVSQELRIQARRVRWFDASCESNYGPVTLIRPLLECSVVWREVKKTEHHGLFRDVYGTTYSGEPARMLVPQEGYSTEYATGEYHVEISHCPTQWKVAHNHVARLADGSLQYRGRVERQSGKREISVDLGPLSKELSANLRAEWKSLAEPKIAELEAAFKSRLLAESETVAMDQYLRDESALRERSARDAAEKRDRAERASALAAKRLDDLRAKHGVGDSFREISHGLDGSISWAIAMGRDGQAALIDEASCWAGSLAGARASIEVVAPGAGNALDTLELTVQVEDPEFERERLAKRRFKIMRGQPKDKLLAWADRVQILAASAATEGDALASPRGETSTASTRNAHEC